MSITSIFIKAKLFFESEDGASGIEYAIVATLVAVVLAFFAAPISTEVTEIFEKICTGIGATGCTAASTP